MDGSDMETKQALVKSQEVGVNSHQDVAKVMEEQILPILFWTYIIIFLKTMIIEAVLYTFVKLMNISYIISFVVTCVALSNPDHGKVSFNRSPVNGRYPMNTIASYSCNYGYKEIKNTRYCHPSTNWFGDIPTCGLSNEY